MKKSLALLLTVAMLISSVLAAIPLAASAEEPYYVNDDTLSLRTGSGTGLSIGANGKTVILNQPVSNPSAPAHWSNTQLIAQDDVKDGFTVKISDIKWDEANDNAVAIVYSNASDPHPSLVDDTSSNFTLLVRKDGSIVFWGDGYRSDFHAWGKWTSVISLSKTLGETVNEFTYKLVPNADKSVYTFYVNDVVVYEYNATAPLTDSSIFSNPDKPCNFGFLVMNGTGDWDNGWGSEPIGTLSYRIDKVEPVGKETPVVSQTNVNLEYRSGGGTGLYVSGDRVVLTQAEPNPDAPVLWSNGQLWANDSAKDGFSVKISDIKWDEVNDNAVAIVYSNAAAPHPGIISDETSNFTLLVRKDGSIVFWGNGVNDNHLYGKWAGVFSLDKTLGETVTEFTYKMIPNADLTKFNFYVNDLLIYTYDVAAVAANDAAFHYASVLNNLDKPCNFGFLVMNGTGNWEEAGWAIEPTGTLSYRVESVGATALDDISLELRDGGSTGLGVSGNKVTLDKDSYAAQWGNAQLWAHDDPADGFEVKISDIKWDENNNNAVTIIYGNGAVPYLNQTDSYTSNFVLLVKRDGSIVFWGDGYRADMAYGLWTGVKSTDVSLGESVTEFTYKMAPNADKTVYYFYVNDVLVYVYNKAAQAAADENGAYASVLNNPNGLTANFGFMVLDGTFDAEKEGWGRMPVGTLSYTVESVKAFAEAEDIISLELRDGGSTGLGVSYNRVVLSDGSYAAHWGNAQLMAQDDPADGFEVKISDIRWDENNNNAVTIIYGNGGVPYLNQIDSYTSNFVLLVKRDGSIVFWGDGYRADMAYGLWTGVKSTDKTLGETVKEFTYKMTPNADKTVYYFYVNDVLVYTYNKAAQAAADENGAYASVLNNPNGLAANFGFMVLDGTYDAAKEGWGRMPVGTLSYTVESVKDKGEFNPYSLDALELRGGGSTGFDVWGNTVVLSEGSYAAHWANAQLMAQDDAADGFTVKISDIKWDDDTNNAVAIVYGNGDTPYPTFIDGTTSNFILLVRKDGSIIFWGDGYRQDQAFGLWTGVYTSDKTLGKAVNEFTYKMVPNANNTEYYFYVNDLLIYTYNKAAQAAADENGAYASVLNNLDKKCNFGFMVLDGTYNGENGFGSMPTGTLSYKVAGVESKGETDFYNLSGLELRGGGSSGFDVWGNTITLSEGSYAAHWGNAQLMAQDDAADGFEVKISDIQWDDNTNNAVAIVYGNGDTPYPTFIDGTTSNFVLLVRKDGKIILWGDGYRQDQAFGLWTGVYTSDKTLGKAVNEFTYKMVPNADNSVYSFYVDDILVYEYDMAAQAAADENGAYASVLNNLDKKCNFGFMVLDGTYNGENGFGSMPTGTFSYKVKEINKVGYEFNSNLDLDSDGAVANSDAAIIVRHLSGWNVAANEFDVNRDGKVNNRDAIYLIQYLNGFSVKPITILDSGSSKYSIVVSDYNLKADCAGVYLKKQFLNKTGIDLEITTDWALYDRNSFEIIVGETERLGTQLTSQMKTEIYKDGFVIKALGNRIWIAGENEDATKAGVDYFLATYVVGTSVTLSNSLNFVKTSEATHTINSFTVLGNDVADYVIECDMSSYEQYALAKKLRDLIWDNAGVDLEIVEKANTGAKKISFTLNAIANGQPTYKVQTVGGDVVFYATNIDCLTKALDFFLREYLGYISDADQNIPGTVAVPEIDVTFSFDKITSLTIAGKDISEYVIYDSSSAASASFAASQLASYLYDATDVSLSVVTTAADQPMITLVYDETMGENYSLKTDANGLTIKGGENGILYGVFGFLEDYIGWNFLPYNTNVLISDSTVVIDNVDVEYNQYFEFRAPHYGGFQNSWTAVMNGVNGDMGNNRVDLPDYLGSFYGFTGSYVHTLSSLLGIEEADATDSNPCFSSQESYDKVLASVREILAAHPDAQIISVSQNDSSFCQCSGCTGANLGGNVTDAILSLVNYVANNIAAEYPNVKIHTLAYGETADLPKVTVPADNVIVQLCEYMVCYNHALEDPNCATNVEYIKLLDGWTDICDNVYVWTYTTNNLYSMATFPIFDVLKDNIQTYHKYGVKGVYAQGDVLNNFAKFEDLAGHLIAELLENPYMTDEEYDALINKFMRGYYGEGWESIRAYLDFLVDNSTQGHFGVYAIPEAMYNGQAFIDNEDVIEGYFNEAEKLVDSNASYANLALLRTSWNYLKLFFTYNNVMTNGTWSEKRAMKEEAAATFDEICDANYRLTDILPPLSELSKVDPVDKTDHPRYWLSGKHESNNADHGIPDFRG